MTDPYIPRPRPHVDDVDTEPLPLDLVEEGRPPVRYVVTVLGAATVCTCAVLAWSAYLTVRVIEAAAAAGT